MKETRIEKRKSLEFVFNQSQWVEAYQPQYRNSAEDPDWINLGAKVYSLEKAQHIIDEFIENGYEESSISHIKYP